MLAVPFEAEQCLETLASASADDVTWAHPGHGSADAY
jgi:hypothetical protein